MTSSAAGRPLARRKAEGPAAGSPALPPAPTPTADAGPTTAERIADLTAHIAKLEGELEDARRAGEEARQTRQRVAFDASRGDVAAVKALQGATETSARAAVDVENVQLAIQGARERLAALEAQAETERLAAERLEALALCDRRAEAARRVDKALADLWRALGDWRDPIPELARLRDRGQNWLPPDMDPERWALPMAAAAVALEMPIKLNMGFIAIDHARRLVDTDPVVVWGRKERGEDVCTLAVGVQAARGIPYSPAPDPDGGDDDDELGEAA